MNLSKCDAAIISVFLEVVADPLYIKHKQGTRFGKLDHWGCAYLLEEGCHGGRM